MNFRLTRTRSQRAVVLLATALVLTLGAIVPAFAQDEATPSPGRRDNSVPPPPSIGSDVSLPYFAPPPSEVQKELIGPYELLKAGTIDMEASTITLPLYKGQMEDGRAVWYILTDTSDQANAEALGLNHSAKLAYAAVGKAARNATLGTDATLTFDRGTVDFTPEHQLVPGDAPNPFPPKVAEPGSVGDADYSPLVQIANSGNAVYNAPVVAFDKTAAQIRACNGKKPNYDLVHDRVARICPNGNGGGTVTIKLTGIFSFAKPALYMSTEASDPMVATLDQGTFAPAIGELPVGRDDSVFSAIERLFVIANGPTGRLNPQRQGLNSALMDKGPGGMPLPPLNLVGGLPTVALDYSPAWDLNLGFWTAEAIRKGYRSRVIDEFQLLGYVVGGHITGPDGKPFGSTGIVVNCPIVARLL